MELAPLVDRAAEMSQLASLWADVVDRRQARLAVLHGRRQVGKTFLLAHLVDRVRSAGGRAVLATAISGAAPRQQLDALAGAVRAALPEEAALVPERFSDWPAALAWVGAVAERAPLLVVLDEVPWYIATTPTWPSHLQVAWDEVRRQRRPPALLLVVTGSAVATMRALVDGRGALFGRADMELHVRPFDLPAAAQLLGSPDPGTVIEAYAACGGYPLHLRAWDAGAPAEANLRRLIAEPGSLLAHSGERMLADLPDEGGHLRVLHAIGSGAHQRGRIGEQAGQRLERPLALLTRAGLVRLDRPLGAPDRTPGRYEVTDTYLRCWYELCWADLGLIDGGQGAAVLQRRRPRWLRHLAAVFEEQARLHAVRLAASGSLPADAVYGRWWTTSGPQAEVDVLGIVGRRSVVVGEAKWRDQPMDARDLADLRRKASAVPDPVADPVLAWWGRTPIGRDAAAAGVLGFTPADMVGA
ncbi:MAG: ATP-binding protein [Acidimicrobiales bacterium]